MTNRTRTLVAVPAAALLVLLTAGCGRKPDATASAPGPAPAPTTTAPAPVPQADATLGSSIDANNNIVTATDRFKPTDTIYVSVATSQTAPGSTLTARWLDQEGTVINESTQTVVSTAGAGTEFHIAKPDGWPAGEYKVELSLNGQPLTTKTFAVAVGA
jgi:hypothetical protein